MISIIADKQIRLLKLRMKSAPEIFKGIEKSRKFLEEWLPWIDDTRKIEDVRRFIRMVNRQDCPKKDLVFEIWFGEEFAGLVTLKELDTTNKKAEIGYWLLEKFSGRGIMIRSCNALLRYAFEELKLNKVQIKCGVDNIRSCNIPKQLNFTFEGIERDGELLRNRFQDLKVYSLLRREWNRKNN